jgi:hypothetical protein
MKSHSGPIFFFLLWFGVSLTVAQHAASEDKEHARGLIPNFESGKVDGMRVTILKAIPSNATNKKFVPTSPAQVFRAGDQIQVVLESNFTGYVYILNITPSGQKRVIFPKSGVNNHITAFRRYIFPRKDRSFDFDEEKGIEIIQVLLTLKPISTLDTAIAKEKGLITEAETLSSARPAGSTDLGILAASTTPQMPGLEARQVLIAPDKNGAIVALKRKPEPPRSRSLTPTKSKESKKSKTSSQAQPMSANARPEEVEGKLGEKDIATFEIRLKHQ